jgi:hypothetical protein
MVDLYINNTIYIVAIVVTLVCLIIMHVLWAVMVYDYHKRVTVVRNKQLDCQDNAMEQETLRYQFKNIFTQKEPKSIKGTLFAFFLLLIILGIFLIAFNTRRTYSQPQNPPSPPPLRNQIFKWQSWKDPNVFHLGFFFIAFVTFWVTDFALMVRYFGFVGKQEKGFLYKHAQERAGIYENLLNVFANQIKRFSDFPGTLQKNMIQRYRSLHNNERMSDAEIRLKFDEMVANMVNASGEDKKRHAHTLLGYLKLRQDLIHFKNNQNIVLTENVTFKLLLGETVLADISLPRPTTSTMTLQDFFESFNRALNDKLNSSYTYNETSKTETNRIDFITFDGTKVKYDFSHYTIELMGNSSNTFTNQNDPNKFITTGTTTGLNTLKEGTYNFKLYKKDDVKFDSGKFPDNYFEERKDAYGIVYQKTKDGRFAMDASNLNFAIEVKSPLFGLENSAGSNRTLLKNNMIYSNTKVSSPWELSWKPLIDLHTHDPFGALRTEFNNLFIEIWIGIMVFIAYFMYLIKQRLLSK